MEKRCENDKGRKVLKRNCLSLLLTSGPLAFANGILHSCFSCHPEFSSGSREIPKQVRNDNSLEYRVPQA